MSSPMVNGIYYSKMRHYDNFKWAMVDDKSEWPAHFEYADGPCYVVRKYYLGERWIYIEPLESTIIMPEGMYRW
jgi:hypothetical protein